jgi:hypothetical protein
MSLEAKIEALTIAVQELTAHIRNATGGTAPAADVPPAEDEPVQAEPRKAKKPKAEKAEKPSAEKPKAPEYAEVAKKFLEYIAANGRDAALEILEPWSTTSLKGVPAEDLGQVLEKISG